LSNDIANKILNWRKDPVLFVREVFGVEPDDWQAEFLTAFPKCNRLALKANKGPGKTCVLAWAVWNFLATRPHPKCAGTSITKDNLDDGLWTEMAKWMNASPFLKENFIWQKTRISYKHQPETWYFSARTWSKSGDSRQQADTLAGLHADYLLFVLDEAGGIPSSVMAAAEAGLSTGIETKIIMAGNPTHLEGPLYDACTADRHLWHIQEITGDPDDPKRAKRVSIDWCKQQIAKYGRDNPWVLVNVFGKFPPNSLNTLLGPEEVEAAMKRELMPHHYDWAQKRLGIDVARFGDDATVIFPRQGLCAFQPIEMRNARTTEIAAKVAASQRNWGSEVELVDGTGGYGAGVIDNLHSIGMGPMEVNFAGRATDPRYFNIRTEMYFMLAEWIKNGGALPRIPELVGELTTPTYTFQNNKMRLEEKDQVKERIGRSPDYADALALTFAIPDAPAKTDIEHAIGEQQADKAQSEYDPMAAY
jgi:hypothetical protein